MREEETYYNWKNPENTPSGPQQDTLCVCIAHTYTCTPELACIVYTYVPVALPQRLAVVHCLRSSPAQVPSTKLHTVPYRQADGLGEVMGGRVRAGGVCHRLIRSSGTQTISSGPFGGPTRHTSLSAAVTSVWMLQGLSRLCTVIFLGPEESLGDIAQSPAWQRLQLNGSPLRGRSGSPSTVHPAVRATSLEPQ